MFRPCWYLTLALLVFHAAAQGGESSLRAGASTSNITPELGLPIVGGFVPFPSKNIHDELHARCLVLQQGKTTLALVVLDLLGIDRIVSDEARETLQKDLGIPRENVLICATHTHSASSALGEDPRVIRLSTDPYQRFVAKRIVDGVKRAHHRLAPAQLGWGSVSIPDHLFNRRWFLKEGKMLPNPFGEIDKVKMNPGAGNPDLVEPAGPTDPEVPILSVRHADGRPLAVFASYSLHYVGGIAGADISADYYGRYCEILTSLVDPERKHPDFVALLANGTSGDVNNINFRNPRPKMNSYEQMEKVADDVAKKVFATLAKIEHRPALELSAKYREPMIGTRRPNAQQLAWAKKKLAESPTKSDLPTIYAKRTMRMAEHPETLKMPLQVLKIGEHTLGTMPCEVFTETGLAFKKQMHTRASLVSLAHGYYGYLPTPRQHALGGYETWLGTNRLEIEASEKMLSQLVEMAHSK